MADLTKVLLIPCLLVLTLLLAGCTGVPNQGPAVTPSPTGPSVTITSPADGAVLPAGNITVTVAVSNFRLVPAYGQGYVAGEGHLHYYMDLPFPTPAERAPSTPAGHFVPSSDTSYTFVDVPAGTHNFTVELANNDHSPFSAPIFSRVTVTVTGQLPSATTVTTLPAGADPKVCTTDADCVPEQCCHPTSCINQAAKGACTLLCTNVCLGPIDCGVGHCSCIGGRCAAIPGPAPATP